MRPIVNFPINVQFKRCLFKQKINRGKQARIQCIMVILIAGKKPVLLRKYHLPRIMAMNWQDM